MSSTAKPNKFDWGTDPKPDVTLNACGGMRLMSVEEPEPGAVGFTRVVSTSVQPSPLKPHLPDAKGRDQLIRTSSR